MSRFRRSHRDDNRPTDSDGPDPSHLLLQVREQLNHIDEYRQEHEHLARVIRERLNQLDGMAQKAALSGLLQEGISILALQHELAQQLTQLNMELGQTEMLERRLHAAEQQMSERTDAGHVPHTTPVGTICSDLGLEDQLLPSAHEPTQPAHQTRLTDEMSPSIAGVAGL